MLVTCRQMQEIEEQAFARGVAAADLMEAAGKGIGGVVRQFFPEPGTLILFLGKGNNAGDALVAADLLRQEGWRIGVRFATSTDQLKELPARYWQKLRASGPTLLDDVARLQTIAGPLVLLDGLLGIGAKGEMRPELRKLAAEMNALRQSCHATTIAMDIPSGLDGDTGVPSPDAVVADITATVACVKVGLLQEAALNHVGRLALVPLQDLAQATTTTAGGDSLSTLLEPSLLRTWWPRRPFDFHKGQAGRVGILAGSPGFIGAAVLCSRAALRAGAGLVTLWVKAPCYAQVAALVPPEVMVKSVADYREVLNARHDALAIGPGLGLDSQEEIMEVIAQSEVPAVVDADALTMLARSGMQALRQSKAPRLLTPHPGEMKRLLENHPEWQEMDRQTQAKHFTAAYPGRVLLLKGTRTVIAQAGNPTCWNSTGHPGMATGGMGDVLTGICASFMGQGISPLHSAGLGAWLSGRSAECAALGQAQESVLPSDVVTHLGHALAQLKAGLCF